MVSGGGGRGGEVCCECGDGSGDGQGVFLYDICLP